MTGWSFKYTSMCCPKKYLTSLMWKCEMDARQSTLKTRFFMSSTLRTCGKSLLVERKPVSCPLQLHVHPRQGGPLIHKLHSQGGGVGGATGQVELGPERPSTWGQAQTNTLTTLLYIHLPISGIWTNSSRGKHWRYSTCVFWLFWDITQLPQALILLCIPAKKRNNSLLRRREHTRCAPTDVTNVTPYQMELGRDCMPVTPPSTDNKSCTLVSGPGQAMESGL